MIEESVSGTSTPQNQNAIPSEPAEPSHLLGGHAGRAAGDPRPDPEVVAVPASPRVPAHPGDPPEDPLNQLQEICRAELIRRGQARIPSVRDRLEGELQAAVLHRPHAAHVLEKWTHAVISPRNHDNLLILELLGLAPACDLSQPPAWASGTTRRAHRPESRWPPNPSPPPIISDPSGSTLPGIGRRQEWSKDPNRRSGNRPRGPRLEPVRLTISQPPWTEPRGPRLRCVPWPTHQEPSGV